MIDALGVGFSLVAASGAALSAVFVRVGTTDGRATDAVIVVLLVNLVLFSTAAVVMTPREFLPTGQAVLAFAAAGLVGTMLGRALFFTGIKRVGASRAEPVKASTPLHATVLAVLVLGETATEGHLAGIVAIVAGVALITHESGRHSRVRGGLGLAGIWLPLAAAVCFGIEPVFAKYGFGEGTPLFVALTIKTSAATLGFLLYLLWRDAIPAIGGIERSTLRWYLAAGVVNSVFHFAYYFAISLAPVVLVVPIVQMSPLIVAAVSYRYVQHLERVTPRLVIGALIVIMGGITVSLHG